LFLLWICAHGTRITQTLEISWDNVDLQRRVFRIYNKKGQRWEEYPLAEDVTERLETVPPQERVGRLFPTWSGKTSVYFWLRPLVRKLRVTFTPHMARHALGTALNAQGVGLRTIMAALGHSNPRSSMRYQAADVELVRAATASIPRPKILGKSS